MHDLFINSITDWLRLFCTFLAFAIPFTVNMVNKKLHSYGDPPWKRDSDQPKSSQ